jgi:hypothetical protein
MPPLPPGKKLAVPPMHPDIPAEIRSKVLDYIERRMFVEAINLAEDAEYDRCRRALESKHFGQELFDAAELHMPAPGITLKGTGRRRALAA